MKKLTKIILGIFFLAIVVEIVIIAPQTLDQEIAVNPREASPLNDQAKVQQAIKGFHLIETKEEEKEWELWADSAINYKKSSDWNLKKVKAKFFGEDGIEFDVVGESGVVDPGTKNMSVSGNVVTNTSNGYVFTSDSIRYVSKDRMLTSPGKINMLGPKDANGNNMKLVGKELDVNLSDSLMEVKQDVKSEKIFKNEKRVNITSRRAQFSGRTNYARFLDDVVIDFETMRLTGPDATFNYDSNRDLVTSMMVKGGVKVSDVDKWATSERVNVEFEKEKYVFKGRPRVVQNNDELRGDEIIFYNGGKRVQVKKARAKTDNL